MVSVVFRFQKRRGESAGDVASVGEARPRKNTTICCGINRRKMSEGAPERGGGDRGEEEARGSLVATNSCGDARRCAELRRAIPLWLVGDSAEEQRDMEEDSEGVL
jgi:hypothetical protein